MIVYYYHYHVIINQIYRYNLFHMDPYQYIIDYIFLFLN